MSSYGNSYGSRIKVAMISKDYMASDKMEIKAVTRTIHDMYIQYKMNPLNEYLEGNEAQRFENDCEAFLLKMSCDFMQRNERREEEKSEGVIVG